jgi:GDP/UDP-N,N'-diacetylbacillosamine 2-epimerase (hydrolysing)
MAHLHFVAAEEYRQRVIQLGEEPERVFLVGGLGIDNIKRLKLLSRTELEESIGFKLGKRNLLVTFHPVTLENASSGNQMAELLAALEEMKDTHLIFSLPNADVDSRVLIQMIRAFVQNHANACAHVSMGQLRYLSCMRHVDGVVGNSSSGLTEAPSFQKGTVNIGDRQRGRIKADSVIDCEPNRASIARAIRRLFEPEFQRALARVVNPYGEGGASEKVVQTIKSHRLDGILKKRFFGRRSSQVHQQ